MQPSDSIIPTTIADVLRYPLVTVECPHCNVVVQFDREKFAGKFPAEMPLADAQARLRCRRCGGRGGRIKGESPWWPRPEVV